MYYELWDTDSRNLVEDFDTEAEALQAVREMTNLDHVALARRDDHGGTTWIACGAELVSLARRARTN